jgi:hypothetical protein
LNDLVYCEEQRLKAEEEERFAREVEEKGRCETPGTWEHYNARCKEADRRATKADAGGTTSKTWPQP